MIKLNFPIYLILLLSSYLKGRKIFVEIGGIISKICILLAGVPQGSVLGPILFIIFTNDAPMIKDVEVSLFADDKLMFTASKLLRAIVNRLQKALDRNRKYFFKWKLKLNEAKTEAIIFTRRPEINVNIEIDKKKIAWSRNVKYLGVVLDSRLNFSDHVNSIIQKSISKLIALYPILNRNSYVNVENKLLLFKAIVRPNITYACPVWSYISKSTFDKLQVLQNKFLRLIGKFRAFTPVSQMHEELKIEYIFDHIKRISTNYFTRLEQHCNVLMREIKYENAKFKHRRILNILYN